MAILNCTPHPLVFYREEDTYFDASSRKLYLKEGARPVAEVPPSGTVLSLKLEAAKTGEVEGISVYEQKVVGTDPVPDADIVVVSALFASNYKGLGRDRLYIIYGPVYQDPSNPRPVGCLGIQKA